MHLMKGIVRRNVMSALNNIDTVTYKRLAVYFILAGLFFSIDYFAGISFVYKLWPILTLNLGIGFIGIYVKRDYREIIYVSVGEYLVFFSFLALYCNFTSWRNLSHLWPLFITFLGLTLVTHFFLGKKSRFMLFLGLLLSFLSAFFFLVFSVSGEYWWSIFILTGLSILLSGLNK